MQSAVTVPAHLRSIKRCDASTLIGGFALAVFVCAISPSIYACTADFNVVPGIMASVPSSGFQTTLVVSAAATCSWKADAGGVGWITFPSGAAGTGSGAIPIVIASNPTPAARDANLTANTTGSFVLGLIVLVHQAGSQPISISVAPNLLNFAYQSGGSLPPSQKVTVSGSSATTFTTAGVTNGNWLSVSPASGTAPASLTITANPVGLNSSNYNGSIRISSSGASNSPQTVAVTLLVLRR